MALSPTTSRGGPPSGAAGGDLGGTYPNPTVTEARGGLVTFSSAGVTTIANTDANAGLVVQPTNALTDDLALIKIPATYVNDSNFGNILRAAFDISDHNPNNSVFAVSLNKVQFTSPVGEGNAALQIAAADLNTGQLSLVAGGPSTFIPQDASNTAGIKTRGVWDNAILSGALPTASLSTGTGAQFLGFRDVQTFTPITTDGTNNAATCAVDVSPDGVTYSNLYTLSVAAAVNLVGSVTLPVAVRVNGGWFLKLTVSHASIGTTTYY